MSYIGLPQKYIEVRLRLHRSTVERLRQVQEAIGATTYSEAVRYLLQREAANVRQISPSEDATN